MPTETYTFTDASNYTASDDALIAVTGGVGTLVDIRPDATFFAGYATDINGTWGDGTLTATVVNGTPSVSGGYLVLNGLERLYYQGTANLSQTNVGCIRFKVRPDYTGTPGTQQDFMNVSNGSNSNNRISIEHRTDGNIRFRLFDASGSSNIVETAAWAPTSGTDYEFEVNWDGTTGSTKVFIDGVEFIADATTWTRSGVGDEDLNIGRSAGSTTLGMAWIIAFPTVQHTSGYTPEGADPIDYTYTSTNPSLIVVNGIMGSFPIGTFTVDATVTGLDEIRYVLNVAGTDKYWDGAAWSDSSGYAQSNTAAEIETNGATLGSSATEVVKIKLYLHSEDGLTTPTITSMTIATSLTQPTLCYLEGFVYDFNGPRSSQLVEVRPVGGFNNADVLIQHNWQEFDTSGTDGYFAGFIWESASVGAQYEFRFGTKKFNFTVPDATSATWTVNL